MKVLFLTSSPGYGHTRAAEAINVALHNRYPRIETQCLDITQLLDEQVSAALQDGYLRMTDEYPELYQKLYDMDKGFYRQLAGKNPADRALIDFLSEQQMRWYPEVKEHSLFSFSAPYKNLDSALINTLINGICYPPKIPAGRLLLQGHYYPAHYWRTDRLWCSRCLGARYHGALLRQSRVGDQYVAGSRCIAHTHSGHRYSVDAAI